MRIVALAAACLAVTCVCGASDSRSQRFKSWPLGRATLQHKQPTTTAQAGNHLRCDPSRSDIESAGSNFVLSNIGRYNENHILTDDSVKPPFVEILENPDKVKAQLLRLYTSGQRKISTVIWHAPLTNKNKSKSRVGYLVNSGGDGVHRSIYAGIEAYFEAVKETGFQDVVIRFGGQGCSRALNWVPNNRIQCPTSYSQEIEDDNYSLISNVHGMLDRIFAGTSVNRWYDLALEGGGLPEPFSTYATRIWERYVSDFGVADTHGFSIAYQPGRLTQLYRVYDRVGVRPGAVAVDMYDGARGKRPRMLTMLKQFAQEMDKIGLTGTPVIIQESYYNHKPTYQAVASAIQAGMNIQAVYQWPMDTKDYWYDTPSRYDAYCPALLDKPVAREASLPVKVAEQSRVR